MNRPCICAFGLEERQQKRLGTICLLQKLRLRVIPPEDYGQTLAACAGLEPGRAEPYDGPLPDAPMLLLCGITGAGLDRLLAALRALPPIPLKAVLTPVNRSWDVPQLYAELQAERAAIAAQQTKK